MNVGCVHDFLKTFNYLLGRVVQKTFLFFVLEAVLFVLLAHEKLLTTDSLESLSDKSSKLQKKYYCKHIETESKFLQKIWEILLPRIGFLSWLPIFIFPLWIISSSSTTCFILTPPILHWFRSFWVTFLSFFNLIVFAKTILTITNIVQIFIRFRVT